MKLLDNDLALLRDNKKTWILLLYHVRLLLEIGNVTDLSCNYLVNRAPQNPNDALGGEGAMTLFTSKLDTWNRNFKPATELVMETVRERWIPYELPESETLVVPRPRSGRRGVRNATTRRTTTARI